MDLENPQEAAAPTRVPRWHGSAGETVRTGTGEVTVSLRPGLLATAGGPLPAVLLAAHARVLATLAGETRVVTHYRPEGAAVAVTCRLDVRDGSWEELIDAAGYAPYQNVAPAAGPVETVLDLDGHDDSSDAVLRVGVDVPGERIRLRYRRDAMDGGHATRIAGYYRRALELLAGDRAAPHGGRSLLSDAELRHQLDVLAGAPRELPDRRFHELFEERVRRHPGVIAAECGPTAWTYAELNARANRIAWTLLDHGLAAEDVVAVVGERDLDWMASVIGVLKAGGVYLPVEPHFPAERVATMLERSSCRHVLAPGPVAGGRPVITYADCQAHPRDRDPEVPVAAGQGAYIYFTSGSTGLPKGALCEHAGMLNHLYAKIDDLEIAPGQVVAQTAPQCFDISLWQLLAAPLAGGRTLIVEQDVVLDVRRFAATMAERRVNVAQLVPSYLEAVLTHLDDEPRDLPDLRFLSVTGEAVKKELLSRWFARFPGVGVLNAYGLTETHDDTNHELLRRPPDGDGVPIGAPIRGARVYVLDEGDRPVPLGSPGEIAFSGRCVARCYVGDPERTLLAFADDPNRPGERLYRSGDFGYWRPDGKLAYLGRRDGQVKIRGHRIELGEVESALADVPGIRDGAVVVAETADSGRRLVAFYTADPTLSEDMARAALSGTLPAYMVPARAHWMESLPLTANGKIDKRRLAGLARELWQAPSAYEPPVTETERRLAALWAQVLRVPEDRVGRGDDFFALGGTSLSAIGFLAKLGVKAAPKTLAAYPVLADFAAFIDGGSHDMPDTALIPERADPEPLASDRPPWPASATDRPAAPVSVRDHPPTLALTPGRPPVLTAPAGADVAWLREQDPAALVAEHGAVLVRGLALDGLPAMRRVADELLGEPMPEREGFAPRHDHGGGVYSSSLWPPDQPMCMHHELSHLVEPPRSLLFGCLTAPASGGITALADAAAVLERLPGELVERFEREGWVLTRHYGDDIGVPWQEAFGTTDPARVEAYCRDNGIEAEWRDGELSTRQRGPAVITHPITGRRCWFNQVAFLNAWTMSPEVREYLVEMYGPDRLPFNTFYGDGAPIGPEEVELINKVYETCTVREPWRDGDLMIVDNLRMAHSREPYEGPREVLVAMGHPTAVTR
ncbi:amino acid adenylation domain-containing protein [Nonomuraea guangzhouensis]|uniref:Amino acid adenylation domain-containing protein n=1 Tax=Nonomuraea guangzhouensis TaxID=1291555 RepID=A0ABW4GUX0_9ACTN|nr:amino acid adenylation domain-containing protein [Nonomuraea guangzhouensis]